MCKKARKAAKGNSKAIFKEIYETIPILWCIRGIAGEVFERLPDRFSRRFLGGNFCWIHGKINNGTLAEIYVRVLEKFPESHGLWEESLEEYLEESLKKFSKTIMAELLNHSMQVFFLI